MKELMEDAAGRSIWYLDNVALKSSSSRGWVVIDNSRTATLKVQLVDTTSVEAKPGDVTVVDRSYVSPGMVVASGSDPGGQLGVVTASTTAAVDVVRLHDGGGGGAAVEVSPSELRRVEELFVSDYVVPSSGRRWLGRVVEVFRDVDVLFDDGGRCRVTDADRKLKPVIKGCYYCRGTGFWPGLRVKSSSAFSKAARCRWLSGSYWKPSYVIQAATVTTVHITGILVCWLASPHPDSPVPPAYYQNPDDLIFFCNPTSNNWTVGDRCFIIFR